jgi:hypothetical protein
LGNTSTSADVLLFPTLIGGLFMILALIPVSVTYAIYLIARQTSTRTVTQ